MHFYFSVSHLDFVAGAFLRHKTSSYVSKIQVSLSTSCQATMLVIVDPLHNHATTVIYSWNKGTDHRNPL